MDNQQSTLIDPNKLYSIGQAAQILNVSIDTLRRWEQKGTLKAVRTAGQLRRFSGQELLNYQNQSNNQDALVPISRAAKELNVSIQTMRRWDKSGKLRSERAADGARMYRLKDIHNMAQGLKTEDQARPESNTASNTQQNISKDISEAINTIAEQIDEHTDEAPRDDMKQDVDQAVSAATEDVQAAEEAQEPADLPQHPEEGQVDDDTAHPVDMPPPPPTKDDAEEQIDQMWQDNPEPLAEQVVDVPTVPNQLHVAIAPINENKTAAEFDAVGNLVKPAIEDHGDNTAGIATLPAGANKMVIKTRAVHNDSLIFITPQTPTVTSLSTPLSLEGEGFAVTVPIAQRYDIVFNWLIVKTVK